MIIIIGKKDLQAHVRRCKKNNMLNGTVTRYFVMLVATKKKKKRKIMTL